MAKRNSGLTLADTLSTSELNEGLKNAEVLGINPAVIDRHIAAHCRKGAAISKVMRGAHVDRQKTGEAGEKFQRYFHTVETDKPEKKPLWKRILRR